jgi:hypothetical protein
MSKSRGTLGAGVLACVLVAGLTASAVGAAPPAESQTPAQNQALPQSLAQLAGHWDGTITMRASGASSSSVASMSASINPDGSLLMAFDGFSRGEPVEGMLRLSPDARGASLRSFSTALNAAADGTMHPQASPKAMAFAGTMRDAQGNRASFEHVIRVIEQDHIVIEWVMLSPDGSRAPLMMLELSRLPAGQTASAAEHLSDAALLSRVGVPQMKQAGASEPRDN